MGGSYASLRKSLYQINDLGFNAQVEKCLPRDDELPAQSEIKGIDYMELWKQVDVELVVASTRGKSMNTSIDTLDSQRRKCLARMAEPLRICSKPLLLLLNTMA